MGGNKKTFLSENRQNGFCLCVFSGLVTALETHLFADDGLLYRHIRSPEDARQLQHDLDSSEWEDRWQMKFHPEKCQVIRICTNKRHQQQTTYMLHGHILETEDSAKYLGVSISDDLSWKTHIDNISSKASKTLGFLRRNLHNCTKDVRETTYSTLVRPTLEYASSAWDPHQVSDVNRLGTGAKTGCTLCKPKLLGQTTRMCHQHDQQSWMGLSSTQKEDSQTPDAIQNTGRFGRHEPRTNTQDQRQAYQRRSPVLPTYSIPESLQVLFLPEDHSGMEQTSNSRY